MPVFCVRMYLFSLRTLITVEGVLHAWILCKNDDANFCCENSYNGWQKHLILLGSLSFVIFFLFDKVNSFIFFKFSGLLCIVDFEVYFVFFC